MERENFYERPGGEGNLFYRVTIGEVGFPADIEEDGTDDLCVPSMGAILKAFKSPVY